MTKLKNGVLIVFEGIDGGGKTTQAKILLEEFHNRGFDAVYFREPSDSKWGIEIKQKARQKDSVTPEEELELFILDRRENVTNHLRPALTEKKVVILDRYYFSTIAYQGAKGLDPGRIRELNEQFAVVPDLVFILDVDAGEGLTRIEKRKQKDLLFEQEEYLVKVRKIFNSFSEDYIFSIDSRKPIEEISVEISTIVYKYINRL